MTNEDKLNQLAKDNPELAVLTCLSLGYCSTQILIYVLRYNWFFDADNQRWALANYFVTCKTPIFTNFSERKYFFKDDESRVNYLVESLKQMIELYIKDSV